MNGWTNQNRRIEPNKLVYGKEENQITTNRITNGHLTLVTFHSSNLIGFVSKESREKSVKYLLAFFGCILVESFGSSMQRDGPIFGAITFN